MKATMKLQLVKLQYKANYDFKKVLSMHANY